MDAVVIGAGFAGLYMLHRLRDHLGLSVTVFEAADGVGGTWHLNRYPGARCDTESFVYCYSFSKELYEEWEWGGKYPLQGEILSYLNHVADRFELRRDIQLSTRIASAAFHDDDQLWHLRTEHGAHLTARYLITGLGLLASAPYRPDLPGLESFRGEWYHTGDWPEHDVDLAGRRVGVIGTGSTGVQSIPVIAEVADHLTVFQRTPQFAVPAQHHTVTREVMRRVKDDYTETWAKAHWSTGGFPWAHNGRSALDDTPEQRQAVFEELWAEGGFKFVFGSYQDLLLNRQANDLAAEFVRAKIRDKVHDPRTRELLLPCDHPFGAKRPVVDTDYFETYNRDNVSLVDIHSFPIVEMTPTGIRTEEGHHELDVLIFATGFDAVTGPFLRLDITGRGGVALRDRWADGPTSYLGLAVADFPNMFTITGPGSTFGNIPVVIEHHVEWIADLIGHMRAHDLAVVEASHSAEQAWTALMSEMAQQTVIPLADSWSTGTNIPGKPRTILFYLGSYGAYRKECDDAAVDYRGFAFSRIAEHVAENAVDSTVLEEA